MPVPERSSCSRWTDVPGVEQASLVEWHRRGGERAQAVAAVRDGADWLPGVIPSHRPDAGRILDVPQAAADVRAMGEAVRAAGFRLPSAWLDGVLHRLKHEGPERVLTHLARLAQRCGTPEARKKWASLLTRQEQMRYPQDQAAGWPMGSGRGESANTVVGDARLNGTGRRWERAKVNPLLMLRTAVCNEQWKEDWQVACNQQQRPQPQRRQSKRQERRDRLAKQGQAPLFPMLLPCSHHRPTPLEEPRSHTSSTRSPSNISRQGRTQAQKHGGRRPFPAKGARLPAAFAKQ